MHANVQLCIVYICMCTLGLQPGLFMYSPLPPLLYKLVTVLLSKSCCALLWLGTLHSLLSVWALLRKSATPNKRVVSVQQRGGSVMAALLPFHTQEDKWDGEYESGSQRNKQGDVVMLVHWHFIHPLCIELSCHGQPDGWALNTAVTLINLVVQYTSLTQQWTPTFSCRPCHVQLYKI